jgi:UDP-N-acetylglucosamine 2-epimerase (non-hydrolysing)
MKDRELGFMRVAVVLGTRPEIIKMSPIVRELDRLEISYFILHTGQHYSHNMDRIFFEQLHLPEPKYNLNIGSGTHAEETARALIGIERILRVEQPTVTLVQGDTNTVLAGALAASKLKRKVGHVEAGLRSYDKEMPEELNRVLADHMSNLLFAPTEVSRENLIKEGIPSHMIHVTGNTIVDSLIHNMALLPDDIPSSDLDSRSYFLLTLHRQENVDDEARFKDILDGLNLIYEEFQLPILYPVHPRTRRRFGEFKLNPSKGLRLIDPLGYFSFLKAESNAKLIITDSGGVQEEACILKVPCVTLRYNTERPETISVGANILAGTKPDEIIEKVKIMSKVQTSWDNPFGDGNAAKRILTIIIREFGSE